MLQELKFLYLIQIKQRGENKNAIKLLRQNNIDIIIKCYINITPLNILKIKSIKMINLASNTSQS